MTGEAIAELARALPPAGAVTPSERPALGYRGAWLRAPDGREWRAAGGTALVDGDLRADPDGAVERAILATAPADVLPDWSPS